MDLKEYLRLKTLKTPQYQLPIEQRPQQDPMPSNQIQIDPQAIQNLDQEKVKQMQAGFNNGPTLADKIKAILGK